MREAPPFIIEIRLRRDEVESFNDYPFSLPIIRKFKALKLHPQVTFLVGENGSGKSTLLEAVAVASGFNAEGGSRNFNFETRGSHSDLHEFITLVRTGIRPRDGFFLRAESFFNLATEIERLDEEPGGNRIIDSYGGKSLHEQSHGESFLALFLNRFGGKGLYILDEPEAALSPNGLMRLISRLHELTKDGSQFIVATHSPILLTYPHADIFEISANGLVKTSYQDTSHYLLTRYYLNNPERLMAELLRESS